MKIILLIFFLSLAITTESNVHGRQACNNQQGSVMNEDGSAKIACGSDRLFYGFIRPYNKIAPMYEFKSLLKRLKVVLKRSMSIS